jgi:hypothetical protein
MPRLRGSLADEMVSRSLPNDGTLLCGVLMLTLTLASSSMVEGGRGLIVGDI